MTKIKKLILIVALCAVLLVVSSCSERPATKFINGDMVIHTLSERRGQVINNSFEFNRQSQCWKVMVRMKGVETKDETEKIATSRLKTSFVKIGKMVENIPEIFNEFELERE